MSYATDCRAHRGVGFGSFAQAHLGVVYEEPVEVPVELPVSGAAPIVLQRPVSSSAVKRVAAKPTGQGRSAPGHAAVLVLELPRATFDLGEISRRSVKFAESEEFTSWMGGRLSKIAESEDLSSETALASAWLAESQRVPVERPIDRVVFLVAGFLALGFPTKLVLSRLLEYARVVAAVFADGRWSYADPLSDKPLDELFDQTVFEVPPLADSKLEAYRIAVKEQERRLAEVEGLVVEQQRRLDTLLLAVTSPRPAVTTDWAKVVVFAVVSGIVIAVLVTVLKDDADRVN